LGQGSRQHAGLAHHPAADSRPNPGSQATQQISIASRPTQRRIQINRSKISNPPGWLLQSWGRRGGARRFLEQQLAAGGPALGSPTAGQLTAAANNNYTSVLRTLGGLRVLSWGCRGPAAEYAALTARALARRAKARLRAGKLTVRSIHCVKSPSQCYCRICACVSSCFGARAGSDVRFPPPLTLAADARGQRPA
jgi:hypothetical protein